MRVRVVRAPRQAASSSGDGVHEPRRQRQLGAEPVDLVEIVRRTRRAACARRSRRRASSPLTNGLPSRSPPIHEPSAQERRHDDVASRPNFARSRAASASVELRHLGRGTCSGSTRARSRSRPAPAASTAGASPSATARAPAGRGRSRIRRPRRAVSSTRSRHCRSRATLALAIEDALALDFGRMRGQHRAHQRVGEPRGDRSRRRCRAPATHSSASARLPRCGGEPASAWLRRRRFWWTSSAMLTRCEK